MLALSACGGGTSSSKGTSAQTGHAPSTVVVAFPSKINTLDPNEGYTLQAVNAIGLFGEGLYEFRYGTGSSPEPGLAASSTTSSNGLTWTFKLRPDLKFSDGTPLTSADVKATLDRSRKNQNNTLLFETTPFKSIAAPSQNTVVIHLKDPYPSLKTILAESGFAILPASAFKQPASYMDHPISAGPYKVQSFNGGDNSTYVVNPYYWGRKPAIKTVKFETIPDVNATVNELESGQIDFAADLPMSVQPQMTGGNLSSKLQQLYGFYGLTMNNNKPPFNDVRVRKAVSLAIDREQLNKIVWRGEGVPLNSFWPSTMHGYNKSDSTARDTAKAKALLAGTACAKGCTVELDTSPSNGPWASQAAAIIASNLADIGIKANVTSLSETTFNNNVYSHQSYSGLATTFIYDYANIPDGMLEYCALPGSFFASFYSGWKNPALASAVAKARTATGASQPAALQAIDDLYQKDQPYAILETANAFSAQRVSSKYIDLEPTFQVEIARK